MTNFNFPKRFDRSAAKEGVWIEVVDEFEQLWGKFKVSLLDRTSADYRVAHQRWVRANKKDLDTGKITGDQLAFKVFIDTSLHDWELLDGAAKKIQFSKETAYDYFNHPDAFYVADAISQMATDIRNFQGANEEGKSTIEGEAKADEKNSLSS